MQVKAYPQYSQTCQNISMPQGKKSYGSLSHIIQKSNKIPSQNKPLQKTHSNEPEVLSFIQRSPLLAANKPCIYNRKAKATENNPLTHPPRLHPLIAPKARPSQSPLHLPIKPSRKKRQATALNHHHPP